MRWFGGIASVGAIAAACSTFEATDAPSGNDAGADAGDAGSPADGGPGPGDATTTDAGKKLVPIIADEHVTDVFADDQYVYWSDDALGAVRRMRLDGKGPVTDLEPTNGTPNRIRIDGVTLFWGDTNPMKQGVWRDGVAGGNGVRIYEANVGSFAKTTSGIIATIAATDYYVNRFDAGGTTSPVPLGPYAQILDIMAVDDDLYWTASGESTVWHLGTGNSSADPVSMNENDCQRLAKNDAGIYWTQASGMNVRWRRKSGGAVENFATGQVGAYGLAADASGVYWLTTDGALMKKADENAGMPEVLVDKLDVPEDPNLRWRHDRVALSNGYIVFASKSTLWSLEK